MNIFLESVNTADEAVEKLVNRGILTSDGMFNCNNIAAELEEIFNNGDLQEKLLDTKDIQELQNTSPSRKEQVLQEIRDKGIISWNLGRAYLPRWDISKEDFEIALEKRFS